MTTIEGAGPESPARMLGRYLIEAEIGRGMMGIVYRARDPALNRQVALKTIHLGLAFTNHERDLFERRFEAEARVAAALTHPNIVVVHDVGRDEATGEVYIAFEYLEGSTVSELTAEGRALDPQAALLIAARTADALHFAHARGVVHRDVKPANIMVLPSGDPKVMDFGVAKVPASQMTAGGEFFGTPAYMAPEQASGAPVDGRSDIFSLGCVLYLMLTGRRAFQAPSISATLAQVLHQEPEPPSRLRPGLPPGVDEVVLKAMAKERERRYADAHALAEDLREVMAGRPPRHAREAPAAPDGSEATIDVWQSPSLPGGASRPLSRREALLVVLAAVSLFAFLTSGWVTGRVDDPDGPAASAPPLAASLRPAPLIGPGPAAGPTPVPTPATARLTLRLEHPFAEASLRVWVDDALVLRATSRGKERRRLIFFKANQGRSQHQVEVPAGTHTVRVEVAGDDFEGVRSQRASFRSGQARVMQVRVGGLLRKELSLSWGGSPPARPASAEPSRP